MKKKVKIIPAILALSLLCPSDFGSAISKNTTNKVKRALLSCGAALAYVLTRKSSNNSCFKFFRLNDNKSQKASNNTKILDKRDNNNIAQPIYNINDTQVGSSSKLLDSCGNSGTQSIDNINNTQVDSSLRLLGNRDDNSAQPTDNVNDAQVDSSFKLLDNCDDNAQSINNINYAQNYDNSYVVIEANRESKNLQAPENDNISIDRANPYKLCSSNLQIVKSSEVFCGTNKEKSGKYLPEFSKIFSSPKCSGSKLSIDKTDELNYVNSLSFIDKNGKKLNIKLTNYFVANEDVDNVLVYHISPIKFFETIVPFIDDVSIDGLEKIFIGPCEVDMILAPSATNLTSVDEQPTTFFDIRTSEDLTRVYNYGYTLDTEGNKYIKLPISSDGKGFWIRFSEFA